MCLKFIDYYTLTATFLNKYCLIQNVDLSYKTGFIFGIVLEGKIFRLIIEEIK